MKGDLFVKGKKVNPEFAIHQADLLERLGHHPSFVRIREAFLGRIGLQKADRVLDVGCGTGVLTRDIPPYVGEMGHVIGADPNYRLVETARKLSKEMALSGKVSFCMGEGEVINFSADNAYHVTVSSQLFSHVTDPGQVLYEMIRVTKPEGKIALLDYDFSTFTSSHTNQEMTGQLHQFLMEDYLTNASGFRLLPPLFGELGLDQIDLTGWVYLEREGAGPLSRLVHEVLQAATSRGVFSVEAAEIWREELHKQAAEGGYYASLSYFGLYGRRPAI